VFSPSIPLRMARPSAPSSDAMGRVLKGGLSWDALHRTVVVDVVPVDIGANRFVDGTSGVGAEDEPRTQPSPYVNVCACREGVAVVEIRAAIVGARVPDYELTRVRAAYGTSSAAAHLIVLEISQDWCARRRAIGRGS
jgi:hypothetical protein